MATKRAVVPAGPVNWTKTRERTFLEHLALSSNVAASERVALVPAGAAYKHRIRSAGFRRNWEIALAEGYARLELAMLERAINGVTVEVTKGGVTTKKIEYSEGMAMTLLKAHRTSVATITAARAADAIEADILTVIDGMARRIGHGE